MPLKDPSSPLSLAYRMSVEFQGVGTFGKRRTILKYNDVMRGGNRCVDFVAEASDEWFTLANDWGRNGTPNVTMTLRLGEEKLLVLSMVVLTYVKYVPFPAGASSMAVTLFSVCSLSKLYARAPVLAYSEFERYLPASARANVRPKRG